MPEVKFTLNDPGEMKATVSITMTVNEWKRFQRQLEPAGDYPEFRIYRAIGNVVAQAEKSFCSEHKADA